MGKPKLTPAQAKALTKYLFEGKGKATDAVGKGFSSKQLGGVVGGVTKAAAKRIPRPSMNSVAVEFASGAVRDYERKSGEVKEAMRPKKARGDKRSPRGA